MLVVSSSDTRKSSKFWIFLLVPTHFKNYCFCWTEFWWRFYIDKNNNFSSKRVLLRCLQSCCIGGKGRFTFFLWVRREATTVYKGDKGQAPVVFSPHALQMVKNHLKTTDKHIRLPFWKWAWNAICVLHLYLNTVCIHGSKW